MIHKFRKWWNKQGEEMVDPKPISVTLRKTANGSIVADDVRRAVEGLLSEHALINDEETFADSLDFDVEDADGDMPPTVAEEAFRKFTALQDQLARERVEKERVKLYERLYGKERQKGLHHQPGQPGERGFDGRRVETRGKRVRGDGESVRAAAGAERNSERRTRSVGRSRSDSEDSGEDIANAD